MKSATKTHLKDTNAHKDAPMFTITVHEGGEIGEYKDGTVLSEPRHIADYFRQHAEMEPDRATDAQIVAVVKAVDTKGMNHTDANESRLSAVMAAPFASADTSNIPTQAELQMVGANFALAMEYGAKVDDETIDGVSKAIEGEKDKLAGPVVTAANLERQFKDVMIGNRAFLDTVPPIGSRYQKTKGDKAPYGYRLPNESSKLPAWEGPWDYSLVPNSTGVGPSELKRHWVSYFVSAKIGKETAEMVDHCRALMKDAAKENCPPFLLEMRDKKVKLQAALDDYGFQFNRQVRIVSQALKLIERKRAIAERFSTNGIQVELVGQLEFEGEAAAEAARRTKPFTITSQRKLPDGRLTTDKSTTLALSRILNLEPNKFPANTKVAELIAIKRGTKAGAEGAKAQPGALAAEIQTTDKLEEYLSAVANFVDDGQRWNSIMNKVREPKDGGQLAAAIVRTHADLSSLAQNADVQKLARQYEENAARALAMVNTNGNGNKDTKAA